MTLTKILHLTHDELVHESTRTTFSPELHATIERLIRHG